MRIGNSRTIGLLVAEISQTLLRRSILCSPPPLQPELPQIIPPVIICQRCTYTCRVMLRTTLTKTLRESDAEPGSRLAAECDREVGASAIVALPATAVVVNNNFCITSYDLTPLVKLQIQL